MLRKPFTGNWDGGRSTRQNRTWPMTERRAIDRLHLWYPTSQYAELVTLRVTEHMPWLGAGLPNIDSAGADREQPLQLIVLFPVGRIHIDVQTQLTGLGLVSLAEDDRGLRGVEADTRRPDLYACFVAFQLDIAQHLAPEPRQQFGITCVQDQFGYATCHLITITTHAALGVRSCPVSHWTTGRLERSSTTVGTRDAASGHCTELVLSLL
jgi:hypothetical protein